MGGELAKMDATAQAELVRRRQVTAKELVDAAIGRIERINPQLNAVVIPLFEKARRLASSPDLPDGPFSGVPFLVKDLFCHTAGDPYHCGMRFLHDARYVASADTYLAAKYRAAGFIIVGRTNAPELGPVPSTEPEIYGPTHNPWNTARSPGGSSGGSAAAVASRMVPAAHGNDGGGSIRVPSSACGLVGLKPSRGRNSLGPDLGDCWAGAVAEHVLTRSIRDSAGILDVTAGPMPGDPYFAPPPVRPFRTEVGVDPGRLRIGLLSRSPGGMVQVHPDCVAAVTAAARLLESLGHHVEESHPLAMDDTEFSPNFGKVVTSWVARDIQYWGDTVGRPVTTRDVETYTWALAEMGRQVSALEYIRAVEWLQAHTRRLAGWWESGFDLLLTPTMAEPPTLLGEFAPHAGDPLHAFSRSIPLVVFTAPFNTSGQPALSLPLHWNPQGLPIGVQLVARYGQEDLLFRIGAQLEQAQPWADREPPVCA